MTRLYYTVIDHVHEQEFNPAYLELLSPEDKSRILRFKQRRDACLSLYGRLLLLLGCRDFSIELSDLKGLQFTRHKKPFLHNLPGLSFSISHARNMVALALSDDAVVGMDIEEMSDIAPDDLEHFITTLRFDISPDTENKLQRFYTLWTRHEAVLKAYGTGFLIAQDKIKFTDEVATIENTRWYWQALNISADFSCHIACSTKTPEVKIVRVDAAAFSTLAGKAVV